MLLYIGNLILIVSKFGGILIIFWASQAVSQLGSSMTGFALIIWAYKQTESAMLASFISSFWGLKGVITIDMLTYENILPAMLLARSGGNDNILGIVSGLLGVGGIVGGLYVSFFKLPKNPIKMIYFSAALSFIMGDLLMGVGQNVWLWCIAGIAASGMAVMFLCTGILGCATSILWYRNCGIRKLK